jgi:hypothetical protein
LTETARGIEALSGDIADLSFNPHDDAAVAAAIRHVEQAIDDRSAPYRNNAEVMQLASNMKLSYTERIEEMVRKARDEASRPN